MTELELCHEKYKMMKQLALECQGAVHYLANMNSKTRHAGSFSECKEETCILFHKMIADIDRIDKMYEGNKV